MAIFNRRLGPEVRQVVERCWAHTPVTPPPQLPATFPASSQERDHGGLVRATLNLYLHSSPTHCAQGIGPVLRATGTVGVVTAGRRRSYPSRRMSELIEGIVERLRALGAISAAGSQWPLIARWTTVTRMLDGGARASGAAVVLATPAPSPLRCPSAVSGGERCWRRSSTFTATVSLLRRDTRHS